MSCVGYGELQPKQEFRLPFLLSIVSVLPQWFKQFFGFAIQLNGCNISKTVNFLTNHNQITVMNDDFCDGHLVGYYCILWFVKKQKEVIFVLPKALLTLQTEI